MNEFLVKLRKQLIKLETHQMYADHQSDAPFSKHYAAMKKTDAQRYAILDMVADELGIPESDRPVMGE